LVAFLDPRERYSAARFTQDALEVIAALGARGKRAIVVGGTGFYIRALAGDVALSAAYDPALRARLAREARLHPPNVMHAWLFARDRARAEKLAPTDRYRVARALEIALAEKPARAASGQRTLKTLGLRTYKVALEVPQSVLDERIAARVDAMLAAGFVDEAERIGREAVASDAVGYPHALAYLSGASTFGGLRTLLVRATRRYAKRQVTWLRSEPQIHWARPAQVAEAVRSQLGW
jgi:tRNA dimethylallyltransferase